MNALGAFLNNVACDVIALFVAMSVAMKHLGLGFIALVRWVSTQTDHGIVACILATLVVTMYGLYRWRDPLYHHSGSCPHGRSCPFHDAAIERMEEEEVLPLGVSPIVTPVVMGVAPSVRKAPSLYVNRTPFARLPLWTRVALIVIMLFSIVGAAVYGSWQVHSLGVARRLCKCRHKLGCYLSEETCDPQAGKEKGDFEIHGTRPGFWNHARTEWSPAAPRNRGGVL